jgi:prolyl-tRNA synthetase
VGLPAGTEIIADSLLDSYEGMIVGANETDAHLRGVRMGRDFQPTRTASISRAQNGDLCKKCGEGSLVVQRGIELGHIFKLGKKYSSSMKATFLDGEGNDRNFVMGCYGFGVSRTVAAAVEQHHDDKGIVWPKPITPFDVIILPLNVKDDVTWSTAEELYGRLSEAGFDVLMDDRDLRPGHKFNDADLIGIPVRITLGERNLKKKLIEIYYRSEKRSELLPMEDIIPAIQRFYES